MPADFGDHTPRNRSDFLQTFQVGLGLLHDALLPFRRSGRATVLFAPIDVHLSETDLVQPDLIAIAQQSSAILGELKIEGPPELVVEILSPTTRRLDRGDKRALYESAGVQEYWILDPEDRSVAQHTLVGGRYTEVVHTSGEVVSTSFPELVVSLEAIFQG